MIRAVIHFDLKPGCEAAFVTGFAEVFRAVEQQPGYLRGELCRRDTPEGPRFMVTTLWESEADYAVWQRLHQPENLWRATWMSAIIDTMRAVPIGTPYQVIDTSRPD